MAASCLFAAVLAASCGSNAESKVAEGDKLAGQGKKAEAILAYRAAVQADARNGTARLKLGRTLLELGQPEAALAELVRAADLLDEDLQAQLDAAKALLRAGRFEDAQSRAEAALKLDPSSATAHVLRGSASAGLNEGDNALKFMKEAVRLEPESTSSLLSLATVQATQGENAEAEASFRQALVVDPRNALGYAAYANYLWVNGKTAQAEQVLRDGVKANPLNADANLALAIALNALGKQSEVEAPLKVAIAGTSDAEPKLALADYYVSTRRPSEARGILEPLQKSAETAPAAGARLAALEREEGHKDAAYKRLDDILSKPPVNGQLLAVKSRWLLDDGKPAEALAAAKAATTADGRSGEAWYALATVQAAQNSNIEAAAAYQEVLRLRPTDSRAMVALSSLRLSVNEPSQAADLARQALRIDRRSGPAQYMLAKALLAQGKTADAQAAFLPLEGQAAKSAMLSTLLAEIQAQQGNLTAAKLTAARALALDPGSPQALAVATNIALSMKSPAEAARLADGAVARAPQNAALLLSAGRSHALARNYPRAEAMLQQVLTIDPSMHEAYNLLAQVFVAQNRLDDARKSYEGRLKTAPNDVGSHTMIGMIYATQGKMADAKASWERVLALDPQASVAANNLAYLDAEAGVNLDIALNRAQSAVAAQPSNPEFNDTLGWVYVKRGLPALAVSPLEQASQKEPGNPLFHYHLGVAHAKAGDRDRARLSLQRALEISKAFDGAADAQRMLDGLGR